MTTIIQTTDLQSQITAIMSQYMNSYMQIMSSSLQKEMQRSMMNLSSSLTNAFQFDSKAFAGAMRLNMDEKDIMSLMTSMMSSEQDSYENNIKKLGYADFNKPAGINIYPKNFESKEKVIQFLDNYNKKMEKIHQTFSDLKKFLSDEYAVYEDAEWERLKIDLDKNIQNMADLLNHL